MSSASSESSPIFCCFHQLHHWNTLVCPLLGLFANFLLIWLILYKTPKEMRVHSRILLQTCILDILLLALIANGQPVLTIQPGGTCVVIFQGIFFSLPRNNPFLAVFFALWFLLHNLQVNAICIQFLYRYFVLNRSFKINLFRYLAMFSIPLLIFCCLAINWAFMIFPSLGIQQIDVKYLANFMDSEMATKLTTLTYIIDINGAFFKIWNYAFQSIQTISYGLVIFCAIKMFRFVNAHSEFDGRLRELNRQLSRTLVILAAFPLFLLSFNLLLQFYGTNFIGPEDSLGKNIYALLQMCYGLSTHWLPILNPLASIATIKPYRNVLFFWTAKIGPSTNTAQNIQINISKFNA